MIDIPSYKYKEISKKGIYFNIDILNLIQAGIIHRDQLQTFLDGIAGVGDMMDAYRHFFIYWQFLKTFCHTWSYISLCMKLYGYNELKNRWTVVIPFKNQNVSLVG